MKALSIHIHLTIALSCLLCATISCQKANVLDDEIDHLQFNVDRAEDYYIYLKFESDVEGIQHALLNFQPNEQLDVHTTQYHYSGTYVIEKNNATATIDFGELRIILENGRISRILQGDTKYTDVRVLKKSDAASPIGKTFTGSYLRTNGSVLHQNFFYRFIGDSKYEAGFNPSATVRTETYEPIGNIGAWVINVSDNAAHRELLLFVNGELKVTYMEDENRFHHGSFSLLP